jgi:ABC-type multidrug transport system fused ATPase/permease subunit
MPPEATASQSSGPQAGQPSGGFLHKFFYVLRGHRSQLTVMIALFVVLSAMDVLGIGLIGPFVAAVIEPARLDKLTTLTHLLGYIATPLRVDVRVALGLLLLVIFAFKAVFAYLIHRRVLAFAFSVRAMLIKRLVRAYIAMPYQFFLNRNSAGLVQSVVNDTKVMTDDLLIPVMRSVSDSLVLLLIAVFLFIVDARTMLAFAGVVGGAIWIYSRIVRPRTRSAGHQVATANEGIIRGVNQLAAGLKEIRVLGVEVPFVDAVAGAADANTDAQLRFNSLLVMPRYLMESVVVLFVIALALVTIAAGKAATDLLATLAMFAVAGLRALPAMTQISSSLASMNYSSHALGSLYEALHGVATAGDLPPHTNAMPSHDDFRQLRFEAVGFSYQGARAPAVDGITLEIRRGQSIGLVGESGSGKTTLVDLLLGLHVPQAGRILLNDVDVTRAGLDQLRERVAYIPQMVFIIDDSLRRNIALGVADQDVDPLRLVEAMRLAQLNDLVARLPLGLDTVLGERGGRLSGGERQRIALARAFYHNREILIFDEATSALDTETEREVIAAIESLRGAKTMVVIAHRRAPVSGCDVVCRLAGGKVIAQGAPAEVLPATME